MPTADLYKAQREAGQDKANPPIVAPGYTFESVTEQITSIPLSTRIQPGWAVATVLAFGLVNVLLVSIAYLLYKGLGIWGINQPVSWGWAIVNFVWWVGIGHAGTLISAILLLLRQPWRNSINRFAEAMTIFAVSCAGMFPLLHIGRPVDGVLPVPLSQHLSPCGRSSAARWCGMCSPSPPTRPSRIVFWYVGLVPDLGTIRDRCKNKLGKLAAGMLSLGWRGSARHWHRYEMASLLLAGLATPLVVSRAHGGQLRLRHGHHPRLARDALPAVLRGGRHLLGLRHGDHARHPHPPLFRARGPHHHEAHGCHGEGDARHGPDRGVRLRDGGLLRLVQRQPLRGVSSSSRTA